jgi:glutathione S-transferase
VLVHHLALAADWDAARAAGEYRVSTIGASLDDVGFVHASFSHQLAATAARFYTDVDDALTVLVIDTEQLPCPVRVEGVPGGEQFPHLYGPVPVSAVVDTLPARMLDGRLTLIPPS